MRSNTILDELRRLSSAEDFFAALNVAYDPRVLSIARLHILRRMGEYVRGAALADQPQAEQRALCRAHLQHAYDDFVDSSPLEQRVFKVLRNAVTSRQITLVALNDFTTNPDSAA